MLIVVSPAKSLDMSPVSVDPTDLMFPDDAMRLAKAARNLTLSDLKGLMSISDNLAKLNRDRFKAYSADPEPENVKPAVFAFDGDTYKGLEAKTLDPDALRWAQDHLRILSGMYGLLRPLDGMQPYRLEMGSKLKTRRGKDLYDYWGTQISKRLNAEAEAIGTDVLVNCASQEYFHAADTKALKLRVVTPQFYEVKGGKPKIVSFLAKRARGAMARYIIENRITEVEDLKGFHTGGYAFDPDMSQDNTLVFSRDYPEE
jgi:cytoplasmic iron level regulating protein YaaA (DUF328/UPF0246 family)